MDVRMAEDVRAETFMARMQDALPPDLPIREARVVDDRHEAMMALLKAAEYDLLIRDREAAEKMGAVIDRMMARESIPAIRKTKTGMKECDIRPLIYAIRAEGAHIRATLALTEREACKPDMLISALVKEAGMDEIPRVLITRKALYGENLQGTLEPLENL